jgi:hypothetical protein|tara:strand:+ start:549 stop:728 length:180 start_codon:yes stop_codon:yes gene_type:complete
MKNLMNGAQAKTAQPCTSREAYHKPELRQVGTLADLTQGFAGSVPDEQGGMTKRNPFQG